MSATARRRRRRARAGRPPRPGSCRATSPACGSGSGSASRRRCIVTVIGMLSMMMRSRRSESRSVSSAAARSTSIATSSKPSPGARENELPQPQPAVGWSARATATRSRAGERGPTPASASTMGIAPSVPKGRARPPARPAASPAPASWRGRPALSGGSGRRVDRQAPAAASGPRRVRAAVPRRRPAGLAAATAARRIITASTAVPAWKPAPKGGTGDVAGEVQAEHGFDTQVIATVSQAPALVLEAGSFTGSPFGLQALQFASWNSASSAFPPSFGAAGPPVRPARGRRRGCRR